MSYTSHSVLKRSATLAGVKGLVDLLGFTRLRKEFDIPNQVGSYIWSDDEDYKSFVGLELQIYRTPGGQVSVDTRSRIGRSYWELLHQNKTLKLLRDYFGGHFVTDAGRNRYLRPNAAPPEPVAAGCYIARWRLHNALIKPRIYMRQRGLDQPNARPTPTGWQFIDEMNPRLFSNNLILPYALAVWEHYFRESFVALLTYSPNRAKALQKANLNLLQLESVAASHLRIEQAVAEIFSFQRPSKISANFRIIEENIDLGGALRRPYKGRRKCLFDQIEDAVENRNEFVHSGFMNTNWTDQKANGFLEDLEIAVDRCYQEFGCSIGFTPERRFW